MAVVGFALVLHTGRDRARVSGRGHGRGRLGAPGRGRQRSLQVRPPRSSRAWPPMELEGVAASKGTGELAGTVPGESAQGACGMANDTGHGHRSSLALAPWRRVVIDGGQ